MELSDRLPESSKERLPNRELPRGTAAWPPRKRALMGRPQGRLGRRVRAHPKGLKVQVCSR